MAPDEQPDLPDPADAAAPGRQLRLLRIARGLSLQELAGRAGVSIGYLSQVERGISTASLKLLYAAAGVLQVDLATFFGPAASPDDQIVTRADDRAHLGLWQHRVSKELLTPPAGASGLNLFLVRIDPGGSSGEEVYSHEGNEAGLVLEGSFSLTVDAATWTLARGDSFRFHSARPHRFSNPYCEPALVLWVNARPG